MSENFVAALILLAGNRQAARSTRDIKGQKGSFSAFLFNTYRGTRCELCTTMHNDAQLISAKSPQDYLVVINPVFDKPLQQLSYLDSDQVLCITSPHSKHRN
jgi:hypothetical protein